MSRIIPCGQTDGWTDGRTDVTKLIASFRNFAKATTNELGILCKGSAVLGTIPELSW